MVIGRFEIEVTFDGTVSGFTSAQLTALAQAVKNAIDADATTTAALAVSGGNFALPRMWYNPGVSTPSNMGGNPGTIIVT
jgi:hypothetical protein